MRTPRPRSFNGTVLAEWNNVTLGQDMDFIWQATKHYLMREGYAVVTVSAQKVGVANLKTWSPARYGGLTLDAPNTDPAGGTLDAQGDVLSWDVFSQVVKALRTHGNKALRGLDAKRFIAAGESQSAFRLTTYFNSIDPFHRLVDGVIYYDRAGPLRRDSSTKVMDVATEVFPMPAAPDTATQRHWEIAGASHISFDESRRVDSTMARDNAVGNTISGLITGCTYMPLFSTIPNWMVVSAGIDKLNGWIKGGAAPSAAPRLVRGSDGVPIYDAQGRAQGGIQLTQYKEPLAFFLPRNGTSPFCVISGHHRFYTRHELANRYPDRRAFARKVTRTTRYNLGKGYILGPEARETVADALNAFRNRRATR